MKKLLALFVLLALLSATPVKAATSGTFAADGTTVVTVAGYVSTGTANTLYINGTFGSGTITLEASPDGTTWISIPGQSWTAAAVANIQFRYAKLRIVLTGSTSPAINWWVL